MFSGYWKHYYQYLGYQHRDFDVKGLSLQGPYTLELEQVFVELSIDSTTIQHISANPISIPQELREGSHTIWDYLASALFAKQHLVIIGPPGNGKTTLLKHITLTLLTHRTGSHTRSSIPRKLPILLFLRDHATAIHTNANKDKPDFTLIEALHDHLKRWEQPDPLENVSGLLLERENGYSFAHLTFQEYLAAIYLREKHLIDKLLAHVEDSWWRETIRLYCAMADATPIIEACLAGDPPSVPALVLAFDCQKEALKLQPEVKTRLETILSQGMEDANPQRQHIAAEVLLARRLRQMIYLKENAYIDTSMITCAEYQLFLDEQKDHGQYYQLDHWKDYRFPPGQAHAPIFGMRSSDAIAFCTWLTFREPGSWRYRLPASGELEQTGDESMAKRTSDNAWQCYTSF